MSNRAFGFSNETVETSIYLKALESLAKRESSLGTSRPPEAIDHSSERDLLLGGQDGCVYSIYHVHA